MIFCFRFLFLALVLSFISSCFKVDDAIVLQPPGNVEVDQVAMGPDYFNQIYYKLSTKETFVSDHRSWDLAFETSTTGYHIWINGSNQILISKTNSTNFISVNDTISALWNSDASSWHKDSTAIGEWINYSPENPDPVTNEENTNAPTKMEETTIASGVYLLDMGPDLIAAERFKKIVFQSVNSYQYIFKYSNLDNSNFHEISITKESAFAYTYFSLRNGNTVVNPEPIKPNWDILFTRYRTKLYSNGNPLLYLVTGVLINPDNYSVAIDSITAFATIDYSFTKNLIYKSNRDVIGHNWKHYLFTPPVYEVSDYINYIIKDKAGYFWKLHFIGFNNDQGVKGYPQFEFQRL